jgi:hypothetical protein
MIKQLVRALYMAVTCGLSFPDAEEVTDCVMRPLDAPGELPRSQKGY